LVLGLGQCETEPAPAEDAPVRGLKTVLIDASAQSTVQRFPSVIEPVSLNTLSFDIAGTLQEVSLQVGQAVAEGEVLARLDPEALELQIANAAAAVRQAEAAYVNAAETLERQRALLESGTITRVAFDAAETEALTRRAQLEQAQASLGTAEESLANSDLRAPFDGIINSVDVQSFQTVAAGAPILTLYSPEEFEVAITANFNVAAQLVVGSPALVRLADRPDLALEAQVSELGSRADAVSSFPVIVALAQTDPIIKAGMAVEVAIELPLPAAEGYSIPLSAIVKRGTLTEEGMSEVFVYNPDSSTVQSRAIRIAGVRENALLVIEGLEPGERIAAAGVSFLRDGQEVKLLDAD
jgi:RND family efflux transporter MFP subunit